MSAPSGVAWMTRWSSGASGWQSCQTFPAGGGVPPGRRESLVPQARRGSAGGLVQLHSKRCC
eukprot:2912043-Prorocentrum_lima.AAC.1